jgi:hypothetical protein
MAASQAYPSASWFDPRISRPTCVVCERDGSWAALLRSEIDSGKILIRETRSRPEVDVALEDLEGQAPIICVAWELRDENLDDVIRGVRVLAARHPPLPSVVLLHERSWITDQWTLRELGAIHVVMSKQRTASLFCVLERQAERCPRSGGNWPELKTSSAG